MKNKKKINEGALDVGITSYQTSSSNSSNPSHAGVNVNVKKKDLSDPSLQRNISKLKNANVNVVEEEGGVKPQRLKYLSEVQDSETGEVSKPFTINDKRYQMVRAVTPNKEKVMGVYSLDEIDEEGNNIIYDVNEFEENVAKKAMGEEGVVEPEGPEAVTLNTEDNVIAEPADEVNPQSKADEMGGPSFAGFKHYIVNRKTGKARKFKNIEELAKANMTEDEQYMGIRDFKKYVDEVLFGTGKKHMKEVDATATPTDNTQVANTPTEEKMIASSQKLMNLIQQKIPSQVVQQIKQNHIAQREVLLAFAELIGVPNSEVNKIIVGLKGMARDVKPVNESYGPIVKTIKVKDLK
jgi:predicted XRE-type DNA-binding protein